MGSEMQPEVRSTPVSIVIADDHGLVRQGLRSMLANEGDLEVVGEAEDGREVIELCSRLRPQLVLMDVRMPQVDGLTATQEIKQRHPETSVLMLTMHENPNYLLEAVRAGAAGYVLKGAPNSQIMGAIRRVLEGESPLNQELAMHVIHRLASESKQEPVVPEQEAESSPDPEVRRHPDPLLHSLTERELEILRLVAKGKTNQQIAKNLVISTLTVKTHVQRIIGKLGVSDRTQAAVRAAEHGLLASDSPR